MMSMMSPFFRGSSASRGRRKRNNGPRSRRTCLNLQRSRHLSMEPLEDRLLLSINLALQDNDAALLNGESFEQVATALLGKIINTATIVTHGFQPSADSGDSLYPLADAIRTRIDDANTDGLVDDHVYYVIASPNQFSLQGDLRFVDKQVIRLAETENESRAGVAINLDASDASGNHTLTAMHVLDPDLATGVGVLAALNTTSKGIASGSITDIVFPDVDEEPFDVSPLFEKLTGSYASNAEKPDSGATAGSDLMVGAAVGFVKANHTVTADVGADAMLKSNEELEVRAEISQALQIQAESSVETVEDESSRAAISAAVTIGLVENTAQATVASGAQLDALRATRVISDVSYPYLTRPDEFVPANAVPSLYPCWTTRPRPWWRATSRCTAAAAVALEL